MIHPKLKKVRHVRTNNFFMSEKFAEKLKAYDTDIIGSMKYLKLDAPDSIETTQMQL